MSIRRTLTKNRSLIFAEQFYYPEGWGGAQIPRDITTYLARAGWGVEVICGSEPYATVEGAPQPDPAAVGVRIRRVPRLLRGDIHKLRLLRQLWFCAIALPMLVSTRCSIYVTQTNPPLILPIVALVSWLRRKRMVIIAQDLYPEVLFANGMRPGSVRGRILRMLFRRGYRRACKVISLGPHMSERLLRKGVAPTSLVEISNWATGEESVTKGEANRLRDAWRLQGKFVVMYSGNMGIAHDVATPIAGLAAALPSMPDITLVFIGKGSRLLEAQSLVAELGIGHAVQFRPFVPAELLPHSLGLADIALVTLREDFSGLVVPSKLLGHMARAIPTVYVGPHSDITHFISESGGGLCVPGGAAALLGRRLVELASQPRLLQEMGRLGRDYYQQSLAKRLGLSSYLKTLMELVDEPNGATSQEASQ
jgi:glycosyltransferase involved in cell wall biosynthesis